jgi:hypothetical protein
VIRDAGAEMDCQQLFGALLGFPKKMRFGGTCSERTMMGTYSGTCREMWLSTGDPESPFVPATALASLTYDHRGNYSGPATISIGGTIVEGEYVGQVTVNPDCSLSTEHVFHNQTLGTQEQETGVGYVAVPGEVFYTMSTLPDRVVGCEFRRVARHP